MNHSDITGRLTKPPQLRISTQGKPCLHFTLKTFRKAVKEGQPPRYDLVPCVAWGEQAEAIADKAKESSILGVSGMLKSRIVDRHDGAPKKFILELEVQCYELLAIE